VEETVAGVLKIRPKEGKKALDHQGIRLEMVGEIGTSEARKSAFHRFGGCCLGRLTA